MPTALELYAGIGGFAAAAAALDIAVVQSIDIDPQALDVHRLNFSATTEVAELESYDVRSLRADLWWMSPPCRPFTRRGQRRDIDDPRAQSMLRSIEQACDVRPEMLALENVPPFVDSRACRWICDGLSGCGYHVAMELRCPSELGIPNRRERAYLLASRRPLRPLAPPLRDTRQLSDYLDSSRDESLRLPAGIVEQYAGALDIVGPTNPGKPTACFASSYGKSPVRSGSYLKTADGLRYFSPAEVARLLGLPDAFRFPDSVSRRRRWSLLGNSLSVPVVRWVLSRFEGLQAH